MASDSGENVNLKLFNGLEVECVCFITAMNLKVTSNLYEFPGQ